jgi:hypothetical protein
MADGGVYEFQPMGTANEFLPYAAVRGARTATFAAARLRHATNAAFNTYIQVKII